MGIIKAIFGAKSSDTAIKESVSADIYRKVKVSEVGIEKGEYKKYLGGGDAEWSLRGSFQLFFLKEMGLTPEANFLDIGCGPIRAGVHLIEYLDQSHYFGVDYNQYFIQAARQIVEEKELASKQPVLSVVEDFNFQTVAAQFDYAIAFSVLNHCYIAQRLSFFDRIANSMNEGGKVYVTHASWYDDTYLKNESLRLTNRWEKPGEWRSDLDMFEWGFPEKTPFPILEFTVG